MKLVHWSLLEVFYLYSVKQSTDFTTSISLTFIFVQVY